MGYLRPTLITNKYYCYNSLIKQYKKCLTNSFCFCNHDYCTNFCYEKNFSKCENSFELQSNELYRNKLITVPNYMRSLKFESEIIYPLEEKENKDFQQKISKFEENQRYSKVKVINYSYLYSKFKANKNINKSYYIILFANLVLNYLFYTILLEFIYFFLNPYNEFTLSTFLTVFILLILFYAILQIVFYILFEIFSLSIIISVLLFILFLFAIFFDTKEFNLTSYRKKIFFPELYRNNHHLLSASLFFIVCIISIYEMMLIFLSPTLYRSYFFFCQKGISSLSLILAFLSVFSLDCPILFVSIISFFTTLLFLSLRVKWEKISLKEEINRKVKNY